MGSIGAGHLNKDGISNERKEIFECIIEEINSIRGYKKVNGKKSRISKEIKITLFLFWVKEVLEKPQCY
ncbi:hypothetical protein CYK68_06140 [Clostridium perfringens]|nr:hypothetical protein CYK68_06140 [Clostridium perfringens]